jgi:hypothetical protein
MNIYRMIGNYVGTNRAADLADRLSAWHDAMVAHERIQVARGQACDDECAHAEARQLWPEALRTLGPRAVELRFLRSRALESRARMVEAEVRR